MTKRLCKDCRNCLWTVPNTKEILFFNEDGPWCWEALARMPRAFDPIKDGPAPFHKGQLNEADVKVQRNVPIVFDVLGRACGRRGRWFKPINVENT
jgi:hypothetical protein